MKIVGVVGARPQFIKAAVVSRAIEGYKRDSDTSLHEVIVHTGQHYDDNMSRVFFEELEIPQPNYNLGVGSGAHGKQTGKMLERVEEVLLKEKPDCTLVFGDTNSTLAGALAAVKLHIPIAHVEAGLRSYNRRMPEEINRVLTDHVSDLLFCPTEVSVRNLEKEGVTAGVHNVGDVMYDAVLYYGEVAEKGSDILKKLNLEPKNYSLCTIHRAENTDDYERLSSIFSAFEEIGDKIILPLHPRTRKVLSNRVDLFIPHNVCIIEPVSYLDMVLLERNARVILTDSGGVQKEAYFFGIPCITLRDETEWVETVESGWNILVGSDKEGIIKVFFEISSGHLPEKRSDLFGDGNAGGNIARILTNVTFLHASCQH